MSAAEELFSVRAQIAANKRLGVQWATADALHALAAVYGKRPAQAAVRAWLAEHPLPRGRAPMDEDAGARVRRAGLATFVELYRRETGDQTLEGAARNYPFKKPRTLKELNAMATAMGRALDDYPIK